MAASYFRRVLGYFQPPPIVTVEALRNFLEERAALIAQKCAIDYCRGKTGLASYALFTEKPFLEALDVCRWETFATALGDLIILTEGYLRPQVTAEQHPQLCARLIDLHSTVLRPLPRLAHRPQGWSDTLDSFGPRLLSASRDKPQQALDVADHSAKRLFDTLPIHISMRDLDEQVVYGAVRFRMIAVSQEMQRRFAAADLARRLITPM